MKSKAVMKLNSGLGAILCSRCYVIIKTGKDFTEEEFKALRGEFELEAQYCDKCKDSFGIT